MHLRVLLSSKGGTIGNTFVLILTTREEVTYRKQSKDVRVRVSPKILKHMFHSYVSSARQQLTSYSLLLCLCTSLLFS